MCVCVLGCLVEYKYCVCSRWQTCCAIVYSNKCTVEAVASFFYMYVSIGMSAPSPCRESTDSLIHVCTVIGDKMCMCPVYCCVLFSGCPQSLGDSCISGCPL